MRLRSASLVLGFAPLLVTGACSSSVESTPKSQGGSGGGSSAAVTSSSEAASSSSTGGMDAGSDADNGMPSDKYPAAHPAPPKVTWLGGAVLKNPRLVPVYFADDDASITAAVTDFASKLGASDYWKQTTEEYGVGPATSDAPIQLMETATQNLDDTAIQAWLAGKLNMNDPAFGTPDENTLYVLVYPQTTTIAMQGASSCKDFGGYHSNITLDAAHNTLNVAYAVIPSCGNFDGFTAVDAVTATTSHEIIEAATDPYPMTMPAYGQVDNNHIYWMFALGGGETGDMCAQFKDAFGKLPELPYVVQRSWSNKAASAGHDPCVPSPVGQAYFNSVPVLPDQLTLGGGGQTLKVKGVKIPVGEQRTIDVDLYSDAPTSGPWTVEALDISAIQGGSPSLDFSWDRTTGVNGEKLHLTITPLKANQYKAEIFFVRSVLDGQEALWVGIVGN